MQLLHQIQDCSTDKTLIFVNQKEILNEQGQRCNPYFINKHTGFMRAAGASSSPTRTRTPGESGGASGSQIQDL